MNTYDQQRTQRSILNILTSLGLEDINILLELLSNFISLSQTTLANGSFLGRGVSGIGPVNEVTLDEVKTFLGIELDPKIKFTAEGGLAVKLVNKTGSPSIKGYCVTPDGADSGVVLVPIGEPDCIGVFYESGIVDGAEAWVVVGGIAEVYFWNAATRGYLARTGIATDTGEISGQALSEAIPTSPFATDKHFCEIGHILETKIASGLAKTVLHFN